MSPLQRYLLASALFAGLVWLAFGRSLAGDFVWDDRLLLLSHSRWIGFTRESLEFAFTTGHNGHWQPLSWLSWSFDHARSGFDPRGYHVTNLVLHAVNAVLVLVLGRQVLARALPGRADSVAWIGAFFAATVFVAHPLRVESVAWITERRDLLSGAFLLAALLAWWRSRREETLARGWFVAAVALYALSLLAKAWGITLPAVLLVLAAWPLGRLRRDTLARESWSVLPFALLALGTAVLAIRAQAASGAMDFAVEAGPARRAAQAAVGLLWYPAKTLAPLNLSPLYRLDPALGAFAPRHLAAFGGVAVVTIALAFYAQRNRAPLVAWTVFALVVSPVLGFTQSGPQEVADRYSYLSMIALTLLAGAGFALLTRGREALAIGATLAIGVGLALMARAYVPVWRDDVTLWTRAIEHTADDAFAFANRGEARFRRQDHAGARADFDRALELEPDFTLALYQRGYLRAAAPPVDLAGALRDFDRVLELEPDHVRALSNKAGLLIALERYAEARPVLARALALDPTNPDLLSLRDAVPDTPR
ncbi:MAG: tetratricopeptide repeat protein [Planctomycetota bacterium]